MSRNDVVVVDFTRYRLRRLQTIDIHRALAAEAAARLAFLLTPAPMIFWQMFWTDYLRWISGAWSIPDQVGHSPSNSAVDK